jgi:hypothetical protein
MRPIPRTRPATLIHQIGYRGRAARDRTHDEAKKIAELFEGEPGSVEGSADQRCDVVDQTANFGIEVAVADREGIAFDARDLARQFEGTNGLDEDVQTNLGAELGNFVRGFQSSAGPRNIHENACAFRLSGGAQHVELRSKAGMISAIHRFPHSRLRLDP